MVDYELIINGVRCDLSDSSNIALIYQSPLFTELDAIQSNRSITIELPLTRRNRRAVEEAMRPDALSDAPYIKLPAELYANGVDIFRRGYAVIDEITDIIACTLIFGNIENFEALGDTELRDIEMTGNEYIPWDSLSAWGDTSEGGAVSYIRADFGAGTPDAASSLEHSRPSVFVPSVVQAIEANCGINLSFNPEDFDINNLWLPITDSNGPVLYCRELSKVQENNGLYLVEPYNPEEITKDTGLLGEVKGTKIDTSKLGSSVVSVMGDSPASFRIFLRGVNMEENIPNFIPSYVYFALTVVRKNNAGTVLKNCKGTLIDSGDSGSENWSIWEFEGFSVNIGDDVEYIYFELNSDREHTWGTFQINISINSPMLLGTELYFPDRIRTAPNLPDQTCAEFLQNLMNMFGLFAMQGGENTVRLVSAREIFENLAEEQYVDWSDRVLVNERGAIAEPDSMRFYIDDWAQVTTLDYDNDDEVVEVINAGELQTMGEITIENKNIDEEGEIVIDFSASINKMQGIGGAGTEEKDVAVVPIWEAQEPDSDGNIEYRYSDITPRILQYVLDDTDPNFSHLTFPKELCFGGANGLVARHYAELQKLLNRAKILTVRMKLSPLDLREIDWVKPVYISQFGSFFALLKITTDPSGIAEVELINL